MSIFRVKIAPLPVSGDNSLMCSKIPAILKPDETFSVTQAYRIVHVLYTCCKMEEFKILLASPEDKSLKGY